ncbi:hypothetical protein AYJ54_18970 [Bradyrhizobium centrolobii]|uniref:Uncharacterized protein n=1 Tax=Bradyrhizobium centrolobii TaxID=1505087 RepID=A0A176YK76_9BRAD|nr:hypothetical protein AYJ54_18970 [Bradyrhizobium centrolobii]
MLPVTDPILRQERIRLSSPAGGPSLWRSGQARGKATSWTMGPLAADVYLPKARIFGASCAMRVTDCYLAAGDRPVNVGQHLTATGKPWPVPRGAERAQLESARAVGAACAQAERGERPPEAFLEALFRRWTKLELTALARALERKKYHEQ